jgi:hypothetical protein
MVPQVSSFRQSSPVNICTFRNVVVALAFSLMSTMSTTAFTPQSSILHRTPSTTTTITTPRPMTLTDVTLSDVSDMYQTYPVQSAVLTCGFKASIADGIAQLRATDTLEFRRNAAYILYGGIFVGLMCHLEYHQLFPLMFGTENSLKIIAEKVVFDCFVSAPLMWLPPAYLIKAMVYDYPLKEGLEKYVHDVRHNALLLQYWAIWVPAQSISFSVVPEHLQVAFFASISFFWFILFSTISAKSDDTTAQEEKA